MVDIRTLSFEASELRARRHLVIGAGQVGSALQAALMRRKYSVRVLTRSEYDLREPECLKDVLKREEFHVVWLTAAKTDVDWCEDNGSEAGKVNTEAPGVIASICGESGIDLIHFSSDYVFSGRENGVLRDTPYLESDSPEPISVYGETKLESEKEVLESYPGARVVRTSGVFGSSGRNFFREILKKASESDVVEIVDDQVTSPTYATHLAGWLAVYYVHLPAGILHLSASGGASWYKVGKALFEISGIPPGNIVPIKSSKLGRQAARPPYSVMESEVLPTLQLPRLPGWLEGVIAWRSLCGKAAVPSEE